MTEPHNSHLNTMATGHQQRDFRNNHIILSKQVDFVIPFLEMVLGIELLKYHGEHRI